MILPLYVGLSKLAIVVDDDGTGDGNVVVGLKYGGTWCRVLTAMFKLPLLLLEIILSLLSLLMLGKNEFTRIEAVFL